MRTLLSDEELEQLHLNTRSHRLDFSAKHKVGGIYFGDRRSTYIDHGLEFKELREFEPGDDPADIDIAASREEGRSLVVKRIEPRESRLLVIFDISKSMFLRAKEQIAFSAASMSIFSALDQEIPTGLWARAGSFEVSKRPGTGRPQRRQLIELLKTILINPKQTSRHEMTLDHWRSSLPRGSFIFIISDFLGEDSFFMKLLENRFSKYKVIPVVVQNDLEYTFPSINTKGITVPIMDAGSHHGLRLTCTKKACDKIRKENETRFNNLRKSFEDRNLKYAHISNLDLAQIREKIQRTIG